MTNLMYLILAFATMILADTLDVDVAIVGAGLSGLATAHQIAAARKTFVILEARDRVGGRILDADMPYGGITELGAEFVGPTQDRILAWAADLGLTTYEAYTTGNSTFYYKGNATPYHYDTSSGGVPPLEGDVLSELLGVLGELDTLAAGIDIMAPWNHPNATYLDGMTLETFVQDKTTVDGSRPIISTAMGSIFSTELNEISTLYAATYIAAAGNETTPGTVERLMGTRGGAQDSRVNGGAELIPIKMAQKLGLENILLSNPVRKVVANGKGYTVQTGSTQVRAKHVVLAMSPPLASRIVYDPPLPAGRDQLTQRMPMGAVGKAIAVYPTPWWRSLGLNGGVVSDSGVIRVTFDNSPANASFGAIMGFIEADEMRALDGATVSEIQDLVTQDLVRYLGPRAANVSDFFLQRWDLEEFSRGGPVANAGPGLLTQLGPFLRAPAGKIHFAGTETAPYWIGYMDGAIRAGERVAAEILAEF
ncbi:unnamed protein product [Clonostachys chloroleuca]|uniref:Amine oxidase n=1 Tax=Clonostachys chloroleuca TaxID=1926264 RepID=A0AA35Q6V2_9HYPO|nr:unnamed protein product [Clonostachys chloroleuca]